MCNNYPNPLEFLPECFKSPRMWDEAGFFVFDSIPDWYKSQEMCDSALS